MRIRRFLKWYFVIPVVLVGIPLVLALFGEIVTLLWNALLPALFGWPRITLWQGLGLLLLCKLLFGGLGSGGGGRQSKDMTPEERERLRQRMREFWGRSSSEPPKTPADG